MKTFPKLLTIFIIIMLQSCGINDCDVDCSSGPLSFRFELLDAVTGENLFTNGTFDSEDIKVIDLEDNGSGQFKFISEDDINLINIGPIGWEVETVNYSIQVANEEIFTLYVSAEEAKENCCTFTKLNELRIENTAYELNTETGVYEIFVKI